MKRCHLEYSARYFRRLDDISERIVGENPTAARRVVSRIRAAVERLSTTPEIGRLGRVAGTRELVIVRTPYIVRRIESSTTRYKLLPSRTAHRNGSTASSLTRRLPMRRAR